MKTIVSILLLFFVLGCQNDSSNEQQSQTVVQTTSNTMSLDTIDDDEQESEDLLSKARKLAKNESFSKARQMLKEAKRVQGATQEYQESVAFYNKKIDAYKERIARQEAQEEAQAEAQRQAALAQEQYDASGNKGGSLSCSRVSANYGLWQYCNSGSCQGFSANYGMWQLCQNNNANGLSDNYGVWNYLTNADASAFGSNSQAYQGALANKGSFASRKRFVLYYLNGYVYR